MKCLVRLCPNHDTEGAFYGSVCVPCAEVLKGDKLHGGAPAERRILASVMLLGAPIIDGRGAGGVVGG
jgi:hypothetical protein